MEKISDPMKVMFALMIESSMDMSAKLLDVIHKYENNGIDVVPITELKEIMASGVEKALAEDSLTNKLLGDLN